MSDDYQRQNLIARFVTWAANLGKVHTPDDTDKKLGHLTGTHVRYIERATPKTFEQEKQSFLDYQAYKTECWRGVVEQALTERKTPTSEDFSTQLRAFEQALEAVVHQQLLGNTANSSVTAIARDALRMERAKLHALVFGSFDESLSDKALELYDAYVAANPYKEEE